MRLLNNFLISKNNKYNIAYRVLHIIELCLSSRESFDHETPTRCSYIMDLVVQNLSTDFL